MNQAWYRSLMRSTGYTIGNYLMSFLDPRSAVLCLHDIDNPSPRHIEASRFRDLVEWIAPRFATNPTHQLLEHAGDSDAPALYLTFDDGYRNQFDVAAPIMEENGVTGTFFVPVEYIGKTFPPTAEEPSAVMAWSQLKELDRDGHEIGSHGLDHRALPTLGPEEKQRQIEESKRRIEDQLDSTVNCFAYPSSQHDKKSRQLVRQAGYDLALTTEEALIDPDMDPYRIPRLKVSNQLSLDELKVKLSALHPVISTLGSWL